MKQSLLVGKQRQTCRLRGNDEKPTDDTQVGRVGVKCRCVDFKNWKRHPWVFLQLIWNLVIHKKDTIIFSTSTVNVYPMMKLMKKVKWKQPTIHWVIGGTLGEKVKNGIFDKDIIGYMDWTIVESNLMVQQLTDCGVKMLFNFQTLNLSPITPT